MPMQNRIILNNHILTRFSPPASILIFTRFQTDSIIPRTEVFKVVFLYFLSGTSADLKFDQNVDRIKDAEKMYQIDC